MKRFLSIFLIISFCLSFAACSSKDNNGDNGVTVTEETTQAGPAFKTETKEYSKDFSDENGRVVYTVKAKLPQITADLPEDIAKDINRSVYGFFEDACESAESNIKNASAFMDSQNHDIPWARSLDYEITLCTEKYYSITVRDSFTMFGVENADPTLIGINFDVVRGKMCGISEFFYENHSYENVKQILVDSFIAKDISSVFYGGAELTEEQSDIAYHVADMENFYLTDKGIGFYFSKNAFDPQQYGTFVAHYAWEDVAVVLKKP